VPLASSAATASTSLLTWRSWAISASVAGPVLAFTGRLREQRAGQIVVLIPVATPAGCVTASCTITWT
jgi:hypothetical protein